MTALFKNKLSQRPPGLLASAAGRNRRPGTVGNVSKRGIDAWMEAQAALAKALRSWQPDVLSVTHVTDMTLCAVHYSIIEI